MKPVAAACSLQTLTLTLTLTLTGRWGGARLGPLLGDLGLEVRGQRQLGQLERVELALEEVRLRLRA